MVFGLTKSVLRAKVHFIGLICSIIKIERGNSNE
jgi:hypothetical protein